MTRMHYEDPQFEIVNDEPVVVATDEEVVRDDKVDEDAEVLREI